MFVFRILLIILVAAPVIALAVYFYSQMLSYIAEKNRREKAEIERERTERQLRRKIAAERKQEVKREKKAAAKRSKKAKRSEEQQ